jgi:hypothetical protein
MEAEVILSPCLIINSDNQIVSKNENRAKTYIGRMLPIDVRNGDPGSVYCDLVLLDFYILKGEHAENN